jgi:collagenase-like PrtC family protease
MKPTIVAPWGSYQKALTAARFWAEEVYMWVPFTSLRMRQNKISDFEELKKTVDWVHSFW